MTGQKNFKKRIGEILIESGKIDEEILQKALEIQKKTQERIGEVLVKMEVVTEEDIVVCLATQFQFPYIKIENHEIPQEALKIIPKGLALKYQCLPLDKIGEMVSLVVSDPFSVLQLKSQESFLNCKLQFFVSTASSLKAAIEKYYAPKTKA